MRTRGFTLLELVIYFVLSVSALAIVTSLFVIVRRTSEATYSNYLVSKDTETGINWLRRDLQNSCLATIRVYPGPGGAGERPGLSLASCAAADDPFRTQTNRHGRPAWSSHVYYTLEPDGADKGHLVRWTRPYPANELLPLVAPGMPSSVSDTSQRRTVLSNVLLANRTITGGGPPGTTDARGGFRVQFVRRAGGEGGAETLSDVNPGAVSLDPGGTGLGIDGNTRLVEVELRLLHKSTTGKPSVYAIKIRVCPRY
ncbi:MAG: hypothetical protein AB1758_12110 [Candidatus Eremiobacterota bacterium]